MQFVLLSKQDRENCPQNRIVKVALLGFDRVASFNNQAHQYSRSVVLWQNWIALVKGDALIEQKESKFKDGEGLPNR